MLTSNLLKHIIKTPHVHSRFLNTLSFMEFLGAMKIAHMAKTSPKSTFLLEHAAEEFRHAYFLRKLANKILDNKLENYTQTNTLAYNKSLFYIKHLDNNICLTLKNNNLLIKQSYLLTTLVIETRAIIFYKLYQEILENLNLTISIRSILSEEESHMQNIQNLISQDPTLKSVIKTCLAIENTLFNSWLLALKSEVQLCEA